MMNEKDAQKLLRDRGPWEVRLSDSEIVFKNKDGDVINLQGYVETFGCSTGYVEFNFELFEVNK